MYRLQLWLHQRVSKAFPAGKAFVWFIGQNVVYTILKRRKYTMELISSLHKQVTFWKIERAVQRAAARTLATGLDN